MAELIRHRQRAYTALALPGEVLIPSRNLQNINFVRNPSWQGISGSVGGADFVRPDEWTLSPQWPPDEAIAVPLVTPQDNGCSFVATANRGFLEQQITGTGLPRRIPIGTVLNVSCFVDDITLADQRFLALSGGVVLIDAPEVPTVAGQRVQATYRVTTLSSIQIRVGPGVSGIVTQDFALSRPQVTVGLPLRPYVTDQPQ